MEMPENRVRRESAGSNEALALKPRDLALFGLIVVMFAGARLWRLDASCLWFDEIFSVHAAGHSWRELLDFVALDLIHPPLFYLLLKVWVALVGGESVWWLRLFPVLLATAAIVPFLLLCRELSLRPAAQHLALLLMAVNGYLIQHAREVRMYSLLLLCAACSLWLFARFSNSTMPKRYAPALFAANLLLVYTHYFGWLLVGIELLFLIIWQREKLRWFAVMLGALVVCFIPWLVLVLQAAGAGQGLAQNLGWAARPRPLDIFQPFLLLHEPFRFRQHTHEPLVLRVNILLSILLFIPSFAALCWRMLAREDTRGAETAVAQGEDRRVELNFTTNWLLFFSMTPVAVTFLLAQILPQSIWGIRHLTIIAPVYLLLAAIALVSLRPYWLAVTIRLLLGCWLVLAGTFALMRRGDAPPIWCAWETLAFQASRAEMSSPGDRTEGGVKVYAFEDLAAYHLWYGMKRAYDRRFNISVVKDFPGLVEDKAFFLPRGFPEVTLLREPDVVVPREEHFWVAFRDASGMRMHPFLKMLSALRLRNRAAISGRLPQKAFMVYVRRR
jgi:4-amino-4-deoxy-L-arabinose transferase-like glycosyltransferase